MPQHHTTDINPDKIHLYLEIQDILYEHVSVLGYYRNMTAYVVKDLQSV